MRNTRRVAVAVAAAPLLLAPTASAAEPEEVVDWGAKHLYLPDTAPFELGFGPGDDSFLQVRAAGEVQGHVELVTFTPEQHEADTSSWAEWVEDLYDTVRADRRDGCDPDYVVTTDPIEHVDVGGQDGIRYGFTGSWPDGRPSERAVFHATVHDGQLSIISTIGLADAGCLDPVSELDLDVFPAIEPVAARVAAATVLRDAGVPAVRRFAADRYVTAVASAIASFGGNAPTVVLVNGDSGSDALAASSVAGALDAPVLLSPGAALPVGVADGLEALGTEQVVIIGGSRAISDDVAQAIEDGGRVVRRIAGADRYETAAVAAGHSGDAGHGPQTAILAAGPADAIAAGPLAFATGMPILLTEPDALHPAAAEALDRLGVRAVLVAGGTKALATSVEQTVQQAGHTTQRVAGPDRQATAAAFATLATSSHGFQPVNVTLARGDQLTDALVASSHAGSRRAPVLLAQAPGVLGDATTTWLREHRGEVRTLHVLGGTDAISDAVATAAVAAASPDR